MRERKGTKTPKRRKLSTARILENLFYPIGKSTALEKYSWWRSGIYLQKKKSVEVTTLNNNRFVDVLHQTESRCICHRSARGRFGIFRGAGWPRPVRRKSCPKSAKPFGRRLLLVAKGFQWDSKHKFVAASFANRRRRAPHV